MTNQIADWKTFDEQVKKGKSVAEILCLDGQAENRVSAPELRMYTYCQAIYYFCES